MSKGERQPEGSPKGRGVFHKTRLSNISRQRRKTTINCPLSAQPTDRSPQSSRKIGLREAGRLAELRKSPGLPSPSADRHDADRLSASVSRVVWLNPSAPADYLSFQGEAKQRKNSMLTFSIH